MARGRPLKSSHLKLVTGVPGHRPVRRPHRAEGSRLPSPPAFLSREAKSEWRRLAPQLHRDGRLTRADRAAFAAYCDSIAQWRFANREIARRAADDPSSGGLITTTSNGNEIQHPMVAIARKARLDAVRFATEFGLTPASRARVDILPNFMPGLSTDDDYF